jgi:hypothetical protein
MPVKSTAGPPMTVANSAAGHVRLVAWCLHQVEPILPRWRPSVLVWKERHPAAPEMSIWL